MTLIRALGILLVSIALLAPLSRGSPTGEGPGMRALQALIASAPSGATLRVPQGVYTGPIVIDKPLTLISEGAVLDGQGQGTIVRVTAPDVMLKGFVLKNSGRSLAHEDSAILVEAPRAIIEENTLSDVLFGIYLKDAPGSVIRRNKIVGLDVSEAERGDAIRVWYSSDVLIQENETYNARDAIIWYSQNVSVWGNRFVGGRYGIHLMYAQEIRIEENALLKNFVGIYAMYSRGVTIAKNLSLGHRGPSGYGIGLKDSDSVSVAENLIADNSVGVFVDNSPSAPETPVVFRKNLFAYNETAVMMLPSVRGDLFTENSFIENFEHVGITGGGQLVGNLWERNFWGDYLGYDADGDGLGDLPYKSERLVEDLLDRHPQMKLFLYSPAIQALEFAARALPIFQPQPKLIDPQPLMTPVLPTLEFARAASLRSGMPQAATGWLLFVGISLIIGFGWGVVCWLIPHPLLPSPSKGRGAGGEGEIVVRGLTKRFGHVIAVENLSFTVRAGEALALWGPNGAGKSTVLHCLLGLLRYDGAIALDGLDPHRQGKEVRRLLGFVPQQIQIPDDFTVGEALLFFARLKGVLREAVPPVIQRLGLDKFLHKRIGTLSGGMKQRVALAIALLGDPPILLLDEPTASLDTQTRKEFLQLLNELKSSGKTLIFSSHHHNEILAVADRVLVLEQGRLVQIEHIDGRGGSELL